MRTDMTANDTTSKMNNTSGRNEKNPLSAQEVTCDFNGAPIKIQKITTFKKALLALPRVDLPEKPTSVLRDPEEIALALGPAQFFQTGMLSTQNSDEGANMANLTRTFNSSRQTSDANHAA